MDTQVTELVIKFIRNILEDKDEITEVPEIELDLKLNDDLELSSMDLAELISELEMALNIDPFEEQFSITDIVKVSDVVDTYSKALEGVEVTSENLDSQIKDILEG